MGRAKDKGGLGYRNLESFNLALLAKQGWWLIQQPDTLLGQIYKKKYFPNGTFLESSLGRRPSYAWQSIWNARKLLREGLVWRVGDGRSIKIWGDGWLDSPSTFSIQSPIHVLDKDARVSELIDEDTKWWKTNMIHEVFMEEEARSIWRMAISPASPCDKLVWVGTKNGEYSVRSGYHLTKEHQDGLGGSTSNYNQFTQLWRTVWNFRGARAVKMFL